jgi:serine/threonine-protein kinase
VSLTDDHGGRLPLAKELHWISGTPGYMAPEMVRETGDRLSIRTDVYLLGAILHELITKEKRTRRKISKPCCSPRWSRGPSPTIRTSRPSSRRSPTARRTSIPSSASRELVDEAEKRIEAWSNLQNPDPVTVQRYFGEARFALEQALREWKDNERARKNLEVALEKKFDHDLQRDDFESASVTLQEIGAHHRPG